MVNEKYKKTEIGTIPESWIVQSVYESGKLINGLTYTPNNVKEYGILVLRSSNIKNGRLNFHDNVFVDCKILPEQYVKENDLLICVRNGSRALIGKCTLIDKSYNATFGAFMSLIRSDIGEYLNQIFQTDLIQNQIDRNSSATINQITKSDFKQFLIPIPPKFEQKNIIKVLSEADRLIFALEKLIKKKKLIKQGSMQQLLTGKKRLTEFTDEWENSTVKDFGEIITGSTPSTVVNEYWNGNIPWVTPTDIDSNKDIYKTERQITKRGLKNVKELPKNTLLITCIASIGKNVILKSMGACNQQINAIVVNKKYNIDFLYYLFDSNKSYLLTKAGITATNIITKKEFTLIEFNIPSTFKEQNAIANILIDIDNEINLLEQKLKKYKQVKQGMMQQLLTGKIRLINTKNLELVKNIRKKQNNRNQ